MPSYRTGEGEGACQPPMEPHTSCLKPGSNSGGGSSVSYPSVEGSTLVCSAPFNASGLALPHPTLRVVNTSGKTLREATEKRKYWASEFARGYL